MTCRSDLSVDEVVLDLYLLPISRFISEHCWFKVYALFPSYKYQQLMTCRECHLICHPQFMLFFIINGRLSYESSLVLLHVLGEVKILLTFQKDSHCLFGFYFFIKCEKSISK